MFVHKAALWVSLLVLLSLAVAPVTAQTQYDYTTSKFPALNDGMGTNCLGIDSGDWAARGLANVDESPSQDPTSSVAAVASSDIFCDDWAGFGFAFPEGIRIESVKVAVEYRTSGPASLGISPFTSNGNTNCVSATVQQSLTYSVRTFDFTDCKGWMPLDFNANAFGVSMNAISNSQDRTPVYLDYVKATIDYVSPEPIPGAEPMPTNPLLFVGIFLIGFGIGVVIFIRGIRRTSNLVWRSHYWLVALLALAVGLLLLMYI